MYAMWLTNRVLPCNDESFESFQVWKGLMRAVEWNKKEELVADQALRHLKVNHSVLYNWSYSFPGYWTGTNSEWMLLWESIINS